MLRFTTSTSLVLSLFVAVWNVATLASGGSCGRVRDLRIARLLRRTADTIDWNILVDAPSWVHLQLEFRVPVNLAAALAVAMSLAFLVLWPLGAVLAYSRIGRPLAAGLLTLTACGLAAEELLAPRRHPLFFVAVIAGLIALVRLVMQRLNVLQSVARWVAVVVAALGSVGCIAAARIFTTSTRAVRPVTQGAAPNIILISIDSLRADHLHAYGYQRHTSPHLDELAREGALFETAISPTSWTLPAHLTLLTSLPPEKHGVVTDRRRLGPHVVTLPERLHRAGYVTAGFVSATYLDGLFGFSRGFDEYDDYSIVRVAGNRSRTARTSPEIEKRAINWLRQHTSAGPQRPFFLFLHFFDVHYDYNPPAPYDRMFDPGYRGTATGDFDGMRARLSQRDLEHVIALYDGEIAWVDTHIGRILAALDDLGLHGNTIVAVTADHGEEFFEHGQSGHDKTLFDEVLHVPFVVRYPGRVPAGLRIQAQVRLMDIAPTLLALAGIRSPPPGSVNDAVSLAPLLDSCAEKSLPALPAYGDLRGKLASLRTSQGKLIRDLRTSTERFYDFRNNARESRDTASRQDAVQQDLQNRLTRWRETVASDAPPIQIDEEQRRSLRSLGYLR